jgi:fatty-acyl-CoA synthase
VYVCVSWGLAYSAALVGSKLVLPGISVDGDSICRLMSDELCSISFGVPTVFLNMFQYLEANPSVKFSSSMRRLVIGGAAAPRSMMERMKKMGVQPIHAYGMTEGSPTMTAGTLLPCHGRLSPEDQMSVLCKQGHRLYGVDLIIVDSHNNKAAHDGTQSGELRVRGPFITRSPIQQKRDSSSPNPSN